VRQEEQSVLSIESNTLTLNMEES